VLAPMADAGDGELDVVLIPEAHKEKFSDFLLHKLGGGDDSYQFHTLKAKNLSIRWDGTRLHADDEMLKMEREVEVKINVKERALQFLVPKDESTNR
jgi:diacylglycerol kinase (ATP)